MKVFKSVPLWLLICYLLFLPVKLPEIADSIIVVALTSLYAFEMYLNRQRETDVKVSQNILDLKQELELEQLKVSVENARDFQVQQAEKRAARQTQSENPSKIFF